MTILSRAAGRTYTPEQIAAAWRSSHGADPSTYRCPSCGEGVPLDSFTDRCRCGRPWPRTCGKEGLDADGAPTTCERPVEPVGDGDYWSWPRTCPACDAERRRRDAHAMLVRSVPRTFLRYVDDDPRFKHRVRLDTVLKRWRESGFDRDGDRSAIYIHGPTGVGKSVAVARFLRDAIMAGDLATDARVLWTTEGELIDAYQRSYSPIVEEKQAAIQLLHDAERATMLVVDELFRRHGHPDSPAGRWTPKSSAALGQLIQTRLDDRRTTVFVSNEPDQYSPQPGAEPVSRWAVVFDSAIASRVRQHVWSEQVTGPDMRRQEAGA